MKASVLRILTLSACTLVVLAGFRFSVQAAHEPVSVHTQHGPLTSDTGSFILNGTSYVPLVSFAQTMGEYAVQWDGQTAHLTSEQLTLSATPGQHWLEANGRCLYIPDAVRLVDGRTMVPLRTLAQIYGLDLSWDEQSNTVFVSGDTELLEAGESYYDEHTLYWLSRVISAESQGEPLTGQIAVGNVVLNRLNSDVFPNDLYQVIFQPGQFEPVENGTIHNDPYHLSVTAAKLCLEGARVVGDCMYFFAPDLSPGTWIVNNRTYYTTIGCHRFYL
ncbi:MAG: copper amine oxidase [Ruminococcaceae bacterium]|nr:copper amine oxidase [Oscillospiraceae bacterium]